MQSITRSKLIERLTARSGNLPSKDAEVSVSLILDAITDALARGDRVEIRGFGSFDLNHRQPRTGRNPKTGEQVQVPAKHVPHFRAGKELRERVESGKPGKQSDGIMRM
jgi:integration host factor subunit beta